MQMMKESQKTPVAKLPKLAFPTFDGNIFNWQPFWDRFKVTIDENESLTDVDKMGFLMGQLSGEAAKSVSGLSQITAANYKLATEMLEAKYGDTDQIINAHYTALTDVQKANQPKDVKIVVDQLEQHMKALQALGEDVNHRHFQTLILSKLPPSLVVKMEEKRDEDDEWNVDTLRDHLRKHVKISEVAYQKVQQKTTDTSITASGVSFNHGKTTKGKPSFTTSSSLVAHGQQHQDRKFNPRNQHQASNTQAQAQQTFNTRQSVQFGQSRGSQQSQVCPYCDKGGHYADQCRTITTASARRQKLQEKRLCFSCLGSGHSSRQCTRKRSCFYCKRVGHHHCSICPTKYPDQSSAMVASDQSASEQNLAMHHGASNGNGTEHGLLAPTETSLLQTVSTTFSSHDGKINIQARGVFDNGSQRSYITEELALRLKLRMLSTTHLSVHTFGSAPPKEITSQITEVPMRLKDGTIFKMYANVITTITGNINRAPISVNKFTTLFKDLQLADTIPTAPEKFKVDFLIGSDYMWDFVTGEKISLNNGLHLVSSTLGWLLAGRLQGHNLHNSQATLATAALFTPEAHPMQFVEEHTEKSLRALSFLWDLETVGVRDQPNGTDDEKAIQKFEKTVMYDNGRYFVTWPKKDNIDTLPTNFKLALGRLTSLIRRLKENPDLLIKYNEIIQSQLDKGIIEPVNGAFTMDTRKHYIAHHPVLTPDKTTTKVRIVYDGSAKAKLGDPSLNECLYRGPVILEDLCHLLIRFRFWPIALIADIEKAFLQVGLQKEDRDLTRFLWMKDPKALTTESNMQIFRFVRVPFGVISSPFLLGATIGHHLKSVNTPVANKILNNLYVDNLITGVSNVDAAVTFYKETKEIFQSASMNIREWISNAPEVLRSIPEDDCMKKTITTVLGIEWDSTKDTLQIHAPTTAIETPITKRKILHFTAAIFDPLGLLSPVVLPAKLLLQRLWLDEAEANAKATVKAKAKAIAWDAELTPDLSNQWRDIENSLLLVSKIQLPRFIGLKEIGGSPVTYELHCFTDASKYAYGCCIFLRIITDQRITVQLLFTKSRVAPTKPITLPRLELLAVHLGIRCLSFIEKGLEVQVDKKYLWSDSKCVLYWIKSIKPLSVFVTNRITTIRNCSNTEFNYISTDFNPADLASRGCSLNELHNNALWWHGPFWLSGEKEKWPVCADMARFDSDTLQQIMSEVRQKAIFETSALSPEGSKEKSENSLTPFHIDETRYSTFAKLIRVTAWCFRFYNRLKKLPVEKGPLKSNELETAKTAWIVSMQKKCFLEAFEAIQKGKKNRLKDELGLWIDSHGILRCKGRIQNASVTEDSAFPKLLPRGEYFTKLVIKHYHEALMHCGVSHTLARIRQEHWIPAGRSVVYKVLKSCLKCRRVDGGPYKQPQIPILPKTRVNESPPFTYTGLDYLGPLYVKIPATGNTKKIWICLFTCMVTRAIYLEMANDMTAEEFLLCLRRFIARRGAPVVIVSDNAAIFRLTKRTMDQAWKEVIQQEDVQNYTSSKGINWSFITQRAPWMGGFYERLVSLVKQCLRKTVQSICLTPAQLQTVVVEIESIINSRPLTFVGSDIKDGLALTPAHFLSPNPKTGTPQHGDLDNKDPEYIQRITSAKALLQTWKKGERHLQVFWNAWRDQYLLSLRERVSKHKPVKNTVHQPPHIGDVVLVKSELPRGSWKLGKVKEMIKGNDNEIRSAKVTVPSGKTLTRAVVHLYPLECTEQNLVIGSKPTDEADLPTLEEADVGNFTAQRPTRKAALAAREKIANFTHEGDDDEESMLLASGHPTASMGSRISQ